MAVKQIMSSPVVTVELDDPILLVQKIFANATMHHVLVVENGALLGVISDRDLLQALSHKLGTAAEKQEDIATLNKRAHQIMSRNPIVLGPEDSLFTAIDVFENNQISCIPIVDEENIPVGIISWRDIFKAIRKNAPQ